MKLDPQTLEYLKGNKFSNSLDVPYSYYQAIPDRIKLLTNLTKQKKVLHLGCLDHLPLIEQKIKAGKWLHKELTDHTVKCLGVDIDEETNEYVKSKFGFQNIILRDITGEPIPEVLAEYWDYAILGELLEHIDNPVHYLREIKKKYGKVIDKLVITVPNVLTMQVFVQAKKSREKINSDHRYWFTPYTIAKVMQQAGIEIEEVYFANRIQLSFLGLVRAKLITLLGGTPKYGFTYSSSLVAIGKLK